MARRNSVFGKTGGLRPGKSLHNLSRVSKFDCDMGKLIPIFNRLMIPGDVFKIGSYILLRFQPLISPIMHEVDVYTHFFFVPLRLLWDQWEDFITKGEKGTSKPVQPKWNVSGSAPAGQGSTLHSLWDYLGLPVGYTGNLVNDYLRRAYNMVWNEYYRDQDLQDEIPLTNESILYRAWQKDYFTSARPERIKGGINEMPSLPIIGQTSAIFNPVEILGGFRSQIGDTATIYHEKLYSQIYAGNVGGRLVTEGANFGNETAGYIFTGVGGRTFGIPGAHGIDLGVTHDQGFSNVNLASTQPYLNPTKFNGNNYVPLTGLGSFYWDDLRQIAQVTKWLERNQRAGSRYIEFLKAHFGVSPSDSRLDRPEYVGGTYQPVIVNEVLNTAAGSRDPATSTVRPQGDMAGHAISAGFQKIGNYHAEEFGIIMGLMSVRPKPSYQQGIEREWTYNSYLEYPFPEFMHLGEQQVRGHEIYATGNGTLDMETWGYQGMYDELRSTHDVVCGNLRDNLDHWHLGRQFNVKPQLNADFIVMNDIRKDAFAVPSEQTCVVSAGVRCMALRPIPSISIPGLIDHF